MAVKKIIVWGLTTGILTLWSCQNKDMDKAKENTIEHVVVIGFDGLSPDGLSRANTPTFDRMVSQGASTMHARAVLPSVSSPNWASMIMGAGPEQHGITSNNWERDELVLPAVVQGDIDLFPTIFKLIDTQMDDPEVGAIYHWGGFGRLFEKSAVDYDINPENATKTAQTAAAYITEKQPDFTFVHFDHIDHAGHTYGHGSKPYYQSVEEADRYLAQIMDAIVGSGMAETTLVIISSDHGGIGMGHGGETLDEIEIPFIVWGSGIKKGYTIDLPVYQYDNAATVAYALDLQIPVAWIGQPVTSIFEGISIQDPYPLKSLVKGPVIEPQAKLNQPAGGLFLDKALVRMTNQYQKGNVRYTLDGSKPNEQSKIYKEEFELLENSVVKAALFEEDKRISQFSEAYFRIRNDETKPVKYALYYLDSLSEYPDISGKTPEHIGHSFEISSEPLAEVIKANTAVEFDTNIQIDNADTYTFYTRSDDGSLLWIGGELVVDNDGDHGVMEARGSIDLEVGNYPLKVCWFNGGGSGWLDVYYKGSTSGKQVLSTHILRK